MRVIGLAAMAALLAFGAAKADEVVFQYEGHRVVGEETVVPGKTWADNAVLMVHDTLQHKDHETIKTMSALLNQRGFNTLAINLSLGLDERRGPYDCGVPHRHRPVEGLLDIGVWLKYLEQKGAKKVVLFGHSRGAAQAVWYAFEKPKVNFYGPLVLLAPQTWDADREAARYKERYGHGYEATLKLSQDMVKMTHGPDLLPEPVDFLTCPKAQASAFAFMDYYINDPRKDTPSLLPGVDRRVLVVAAAKDEVSPDLLKKIEARKGKLKHVEVKVVDGADHAFLGKPAEEAADAIADFLGRQLKQGK